MEDFFTRYGQAFVDQDFAVIESCFAYPCMLTNDGGTDLICDGDDLEQHLTHFLATLRERAPARAVPTILDDRAYGDGNRVVSVQWRLFDKADQIESEWGYLYVLIGGDGAWKISLANPV